VRKGGDGSMHFVDRKKNVIRRSGENIAALEVEGVLQRHPAIGQVGVTSVLDSVRGEEVIACIVPKSGAASDRAAAESIVRWCLERLAYFKAPGWVSFVEALPITATLKIQRADLKRIAQDLLQRPTTFDTRSLKKRDAGHA
jgi:acyl-coenzyme A synthetase/AMP-(fatty) acid ligase